MPGSPPPLRLNIDRCIITIVNNVTQHVQVFHKLVLHVITSKCSPVGTLLAGLLVSSYVTFHLVKSVW